MDRVKAKLLGLILGGILLVPGIAGAISLDAAKDQGLVGETPSGYLAAVTAAPAGEVSALVTEINQKRKNEYQRIAADTGSTLTQVEKLAAEKAMAMTKPGNYIKLPTGEWKKQ